MDVIQRNNVHILGGGDPPLLFSHGFGCDQNMWRLVTPAFTGAHRVVLFDHVGAGGSDLSAYDKRKYGTLDGYASDVLEICGALDLSEVVFVGHSVSAMIGVLAAKREPDRFKALVLVGPSPRYVDDGEYVGGFSRQDIDGLLESLDSNYLGWSSAMAPVIMGNADRPELGTELTNSFCRTDPDIAAHFASVLLLRQPAGPRRGADPDAHSAVRRRRDRSRCRRGVRRWSYSPESTRADESHRPLSEPERARRDGRID